MYRGVLVFDTSAIPDTDTVTAVSLGLVTSSQFFGPTCSLYIYDYNFNFSATAAQLWDLDTAGSTDSVAAVKETAEATLTYLMAAGSLTISGLDTAWIKKTGSTMYALRTSRDADGTGTAPSGQERLSVYASESATPSNRPVLTVTHGAASGGGRLQKIHSQGVLTPTPFVQLCQRLLPQRVARGIGAAVRAERPRQTLPHRPARFIIQLGDVPCKS
jgi:hypothetical protein